MYVYLNLFVSVLCCAVSQEGLKRGALAVVREDGCRHRQAGDLPPSMSRYTPSKRDAGVELSLIHI